jgi:hypothetical protein
MQILTKAIVRRNIRDVAVTGEESGSIKLNHRPKIYIVILRCY